MHDLTGGLEPKPSEKAGTAMMARSIKKSSAGSTAKAAFGKDRGHNGTFDGVETDLGKEGLWKDMNRGQKDVVVEDAGLLTISRTRC